MKYPIGTICVSNYANLFIAELNTCSPSIKYDYKYSQNSTDFLGATVYKNIEQNKVLKTAYCKVIDSKSFLYHKSAHSNLLIESIPYGHALRQRKICIETSELREHLKELKKGFIKQGYQTKFKFGKLSKLERKSLLTPRPNNSRTN